MGRQGKMHSSPFQVENPRYKYAVEHQEMPSGSAWGYPPRITCRECDCAYKMTIMDNQNKVVICCNYERQGFGVPGEPGKPVEHTNWGCTGAIPKEYQHEKYYATRFAALTRYSSKIDDRIADLEFEIQEEVTLIEEATSSEGIVAHNANVKRLEAEIEMLQRQFVSIDEELKLCRSSYFGWIKREENIDDVNNFNLNKIVCDIGEEKVRVRCEIEEQTCYIEELEPKLDDFSLPAIVLMGYQVAYDIRVRYISRLNQQMKILAKIQKRYKRRKRKNLGKETEAKSKPDSSSQKEEQSAPDDSMDLDEASKEARPKPDSNSKKEKQSPPNDSMGLDEASREESKRIKQIKAEITRTEAMIRKRERRFNEVKDFLKDPMLSPQLVPLYEEKAQKIVSGARPLYRKLKDLQDELEQEEEKQN